ncbi:MAG: tyrosine--tRNA ligase [Candidatus Nanohaloarchaea archaeon]
MDTEERKELVLRNTDEIVQEEELEEILEEKDHPNTYVGYETSGPVHLGHWASIRKLSDLQKAGFNLKVLFADLHTYLNKKGEEEWIQAMTEYWEATFRACGLDAEFIRGREFEEDTEYFHDILELSLNTTINRGQRSMSEVASGDEDSRAVSQLVYPLMQALDIEYLDVDVAMGATDQRKIHMLAREALPKISYRKPTCLHHPLVVSLQGTEKMSSSKPKTMFPLHAAESTVKERIEDAYCPQGEIEDNPVIQICQFHVFGDDDELHIERKEEYGGDIHYSCLKDLVEDFSSEELHPQDLKNAVADHIAEKLAPVREKFRNSPELLDCLEEIGHEKPDYT